MKSLTFGQFYELPSGVLFSQDFALPHRDNGLWIKGKSYEANDEDCAGIAIDDVIIPPEDDRYSDFIPEGSVEDDHRFLVYEASDLGRLAGIIEAAGKAVAS